MRWTWKENNSSTNMDQALRGRHVAGNSRNEQHYFRVQESKATVSDQCSFVFIDVRWLEALVFRLSKHKGILSVRRSKPVAAH